MSEKHDKKYEALEATSHEKDKTPEVRHEAVDLSGEKSKQDELLLAARNEVHKESAEKDQVLNKLKAENEPSEQEAERLPVSDNLKKITFQKEISHIRRRLNKSDRLVSKVIHQPVIKNLSEVSSKTITRPSGLLGGGITAFLGTSIYLYLTKHIGLKYNYSIFLFLLVAGFILGLIIEAVVRVARGKRSV